MNHNLRCHWFERSRRVDVPGWGGLCGVFWAGHLGRDEFNWIGHWPGRSLRMWLRNVVEFHIQK
jgi:hypothetical protein